MYLFVKNCFCLCLQTFLILFSRFCFASVYFIELQTGTNNFISYHHHNIVLHRELCNLAMRSASGVVIHRYNQDLCAVPSGGVTIPFVQFAFLHNEVVC